jgi:hypothetical protein
MAGKAGSTDHGRDPFLTEVFTHMQITNRLGSPRQRVAKVATLGVLGATLAGFYMPGTASAATTTYTAQAQSAGAVINVFGTELTGGTASVSVDTGAPSATAEGVGTLTPGLVEDQKAGATSAGQNQSDPKACSQGGSLPASSPIGATLGLTCSSASAAISSASVPTASATGEIAGLDVNVSGLLNQIISSGGDQLFSGIQQVLGQLNGTPLGTGATACPDTSGGGSSGSSSSTSGSGTNPASSLAGLAGTASQAGTPLNGLLGSLGLASSSAASSPGPLGNLLQGLCQTLTNIENVVKGANPPSTLVVDVGPASASVLGTAANTAEATAAGATAEIQVLPGVGCDASLLTQCMTNPSAYAVPLIDITIAPAQASDTFDGASWTPAAKAALATVALNIPGDAQTISVAPGQSLDLLAGTPLETVIDLGSASASGGTAHGATIDAAKGVNGGILADLGSSTVTGAAVQPAVAPVVKATQSSPPACATACSVVAAVRPPSIAPAAPSPTLVHTGAWWSGSLPYLGGTGALGGVLLGWPRFRRSGKGLGMLVRAARR